MLCKLSALPKHPQLEVFREDIPRAAQYVNSDGVLQQCILCRLDEAISLQSIKSGEFLKIFSKLHFPKSCLLAVEPSVFMKQPLLKAGTVATIVHTLYPENDIKMCYSASFIN